MSITIRPKKIFRVLGGIIGLLILANILGLIGRYYFGITSSYLIQLFNVDQEKNIPAFYSSLQLIVCAAVLLIIACSQKKQASGNYWRWLGLAVVFLFLSVDEIVEIHERVGTLLINTINPTGVFHFAWIIPYGLFALVVAAIYIPFVLKLPPSVKKRLLFAGFVYVTGALGMEAAASYYFTSTGERGLNFALLATIEETMEMFGILLFLQSLLLYLKVSLGGLHLSIATKNEVSATATKSPAMQDGVTTRPVPKIN